MRVIAGSARRRNLVCPSGNRTRPTTDRIKETLFNILQQEVPGCRFLDLFSGSGGIGIEALSRGAREAVFVERDREAVSCIKTNIKNTGFEDRTRVMAMDVLQALRRLEQLGTPFDLVFLDPPYKKGFEEQVMPFLAASRLVKDGSLIVLETTLARGEELSGERFLADDKRIVLERCKDYKTNSHLFYRFLSERGEGAPQK